MTNQLGNPVARYDYLPFGQELLPPNPPVAGSRSDVLCGVNTSCHGQSSAVAEQFTGMQHDFETGMDYFYARYYSRAEGRFTGADLPFIDQHPADPQSWNLYSYVRNNPLRYVDLDGRQCGREDGGPCPEPRDPNEGESPQWRCRRQGSSDCDPGGGGGQQAPRPKAERTPPHPDLLSIGIRAPGQSFNDCMVQHSNDYSVGGMFDLATGYNIGNSFVGQAAAGNTFTSLYATFGGNSVSAPASLAPGWGPQISLWGMGSTLTYGRRTSDILALNLAPGLSRAPGGLPKALGGSAAGGTAALGNMTRAFSLGLSAAQKLLLDAGMAGAEVAGCMITR